MKLPSKLLVLRAAVYTAFDLRVDLSDGEEFHELDAAIFMRALEALEQEGKVQLIEGDSADETGVKFLKQ